MNDDWLAHRASAKIRDRLASFERDTAGGDGRSRLRRAMEALRQEIADHEHSEAALAASEARLRRVFDANMIGIAFWDASGRVTDANDYLLDLLGYARNDLEAGRMHWADLTPAELRAPDRDALDRQGGRGGPCTPYPKELLHRDGTRVPVLVGSALLEDRDDAGVCFVLDLTEHRRAQAERAKLEARIRQAEKLESLGVMAGGIAHDFSNLLTSILGNASLAMERVEEGSPAWVSIRRIEETARRASALTKQMLVFASRGRGRLEPVDLTRLVEDTLPLIEPILSPAAHVHTRLGRSLPTIDADLSQLGQVVMNLVTNASDALGDQPGTIELATGATATPPSDTSDPIQEVFPGPHVWLEVTDTGVGMDEATRSRIFEPFFSTKFSGRGLGLAAVLAIIRSHRGTLQVRSAPGLGSSFRVSFPCAERHQPTDDA